MQVQDSGMPIRFHLLASAEYCWQRKNKDTHSLLDYWMSIFPLHIVLHPELVISANS